MIKVFFEAKGLQAKLIPSAAEFRRHIMRQHPGIAARDIDIRIPLFQQTVQYVVEGDKNVGVALQLFSADKLDLVEKDIIPLPSSVYETPDIARERSGHGIWRSARCRAQA